MRILKVWVFSIVFALSGCTGCTPETDETQQEEPEAEVREPRTEIVVHAGEFTAPDIATIQQWYDTVNQHLAINDSAWSEVEPPEIWLVENTNELCKMSAVAVVCGKDRKIVIQQAWAAYEWVWKHEFIHYIRSLNGTQETGDQCHEPDYIWVIQWPQDIANPPAHNPADC